MARYADGFVIPIPSKKLEAYRKIARQAGRVWKEHGALQYCESVGEDMEVPMGLPFPALAKVKKGETVVFSWILYKSRKHRDAVNKKVMADERLKKLMALMTDPKKQPFDCTRMSYGGFELLVDM